MGDPVAAVVVGSRSLRREPPAEPAGATRPKSTRGLSRQAQKPVGAIPAGVRPGTPEAVMILAPELV